MIDQCLAVEFRVTGDDCPLARASANAGETIETRPPQLRADGNALLHCSGPKDAGIAGALDRDERVRYLHVATTDDRETYRCLSKAPCVVSRRDVEVPHSLVPIERPGDSGVLGAAAV